MAPQRYSDLATTTYSSLATTSYAMLQGDAAQQAIKVLPNTVEAQSGYTNATTGNIANLHGDPDVAGGTGFTAS